MTRDRGSRGDREAYDRRAGRGHPNDDYGDRDERGGRDIQDDSAEYDAYDSAYMDAYDDGGASNAQT
ncbi:MAG: hypothetical protein ACRD13_14370, partial [Terriglobales bacterium]